MMPLGVEGAPTVDAASIDPPVLRQPRLETLDALRGIAAVSVMLFHYLPHYHFIFHHPFRPWDWTSNLSDGVLLFFMISGFVIPQSAARAASGAHFLAARFARLYPAYWVAMLVSFAVTMIVPLAAFARFAAGWNDVPANFTMFALWTGHRAIDTSYWTLAVEVCFYVIVAIVFALRLDGHLEAVSLLWIAAALAYFEHVGGRSALALFGLFPRDWYAGITVLQYASYFISGMMLYRIYRRTASRLTYVTLLGAGFCTYIYNGWSPSFFDYILFVVVLLFVRRLGWLANRPLLWLGSISYSLYLVHQNIGYTVIYSAYQAGLPSAAAISLAVGVSLVLAWLLRTLVEQPAEALVKRSAYSLLDRVIRRTTDSAGGSAPESVARQAGAPARSIHGAPP